MKAPSIAHALLLTFAGMGTLSTQADTPAFQWGLYGAAHVQARDVYKNVQDTNPRHRWYGDLNHLTFEPEIEFTPRLELEAELEVEHGGVGSAMEFDGFEEFGEFEQEVEQGGEVRLEKLQLLYKAPKGIRLSAGFIAVPVGFASTRDLPYQNFTVDKGRTETRVIPGSWRELGVGVGGEIGNWAYQYVLVSALNSEFFRKYNWVASSSARRFEENLTDSWAQALRVDYGSVPEHRTVGFSIYQGNGTGNRQKPGKLVEASGVLIGDLHALWAWNGFHTRALYLRGLLQNADLVGQANSSLAGLASPGGFSSVGKQAEAAYLELGYDFARLWPQDLPDSLVGFVRWDTWDTMKVAPDGGARDPRFREWSWMTGANVQLGADPTQSVILKVHYAQVHSGLDSLRTDHQFAIGFGFQFFPKQGDAENVVF